MPVCEHKEHEMAACDKLIDAIVKGHGNGRCTYHEELTTGIAVMQGKFTVFQWIAGVMMSVMIALTLYQMKLLTDHLKDMGNDNQSKAVSVQQRPWVATCICGEHGYRLYYKGGAA